MFAEAKVIIPLCGSLPLSCSATCSPSSGQHIAAQIAGKGSAEARGIDYAAHVKDQRSEGGEPPLRCCSLPIPASTWKEVLDGDDWTLLSSVSPRDCWRRPTYLDDSCRPSDPGNSRLKWPLKRDQNLELCY